MKTSKNYAFAKSVVQEFASCYKWAFGRFKRLYKVSNQYIYKMFVEDQERWRCFKKVIKHIHFVMCLTPSWKDIWSDKVWKYHIQTYVDCGYSDHLTRRSNKDILVYKENTR